MAFCHAVVIYTKEYLQTFRDNQSDCLGDANCRTHCYV